MKTVLLFFLLTTLTTQVKTSFPEDHFSPLMTGVTDRDFADSSRANWLGNGPRPVRSVVWYPAEEGGKQEIIIDSSQFTKPTMAFRDGRISLLKSKYPLILISHGAQGNSEQMRWLGYYLASRGYISVVINHNGTDEEERKTGILSLSDFCMWERPRDVSAVLDKMLKDPEFSDRIDTGKIGCAGFSLGGATAIWLAGGILDVEELGRNEPKAPPIFQESINRLIELEKTDSIIIKSARHSSDSFKDSRIKAVFGLAPAIGQGFTVEGLKNIKVPVQIVVGDADLVAPMDRNAAHYSNNISTAKPLIILSGERGHYLTPPEGTERASELREVSQLAFRFFEEILK